MAYDELFVFINVWFNCNVFFLPTISLLNYHAQIMRINLHYNVIYVKGTVSGSTNSYVHILDTILPLRYNIMNELEN